MRTFFAPLAAAAFAFGLVTAATELIGDEPIAPSRPTALVWADRVFASKHDFAGWLESRGASYKAWSARHPAAARALEHRPAPGPTASPGSPAPSRRLASAEPASHDHTTLAMSLVLVSVLGLLALLAALRLGRLRSGFARRFRYASMPRRLNLRLRIPRLATRRVAIERLLVGSVSSARGAGTVLRGHISGRWPSDRSASALELEPQAAHTRPPAPERRRGYGLRRQLARPRALSAKAVAGSLAASRGARAELTERLANRRRLHDEATSATSEATLSRKAIRQPRALGAKAAARSLAVSRGAWAELAGRLAMRRAPQDEASYPGYEARLSREAIRHYAPDIAWCVTSILLAVAVGASIAMYLS